MFENRTLKFQGILFLEKIARFENAALVRSRADENREI